MYSDDADYYVGRAATESAMAAQAKQPAAKAAHHQLSQAYEERARALKAAKPAHAATQQI